MPYRSTEVNANLTKGAANAAEVVHLLRLWRPDEDPGAFQARVVEENLLGKGSRKRANDVARNVLGRRYFPAGAAAPARHIARMVQKAAPTEVLRGVLYYHAALAEHLLYLMAADFLYDYRQEGRLQVTAADAARYIRSLATDRANGATAPIYSTAVLVKLAQSALTALRDFGILEGKARKRIAPVHVPHQLVGYVAYALREENDSAQRIVQHRDWRLFLLRPPEVEQAILEAARHGHFTYSAAGSIRRFDWHYGSLEEYVERLA